MEAPKPSTSRSSGWRGAVHRLASVRRLARSWGTCGSSVQQLPWLSCPVRSGRRQAVSSTRTPIGSTKMLRVRGRSRSRPQGYAFLYPSSYACIVLYYFPKTIVDMMLNLTRFRTGVGGGPLRISSQQPANTCGACGGGSQRKRSSRVRRSEPIEEGRERFQAIFRGA